MIAYDHTDPQTRFLYEKAGFAVLAAYRSLEWEPWDSEFEDATQEAADHGPAGGKRSGFFRSRT